MPTYEYRCDHCNENFDVVQSFHDDPLDACPTCGSPVRKVFGSVGIVFKGSGFYKTDSRTNGSPKKVGVGDGAGAEKAGDSNQAPASSGTAEKDSSKSESSSPAAPASGSGGGSGSDGGSASKVSAPAPS